MDLSKKEIEEELKHKRNIVRAMRLRLRQRELQEAQQGFNTPPEITTEIHDLTERIQTHNDEITHLETLAVEDKLPLAEAEYRMQVAETWDTDTGWPTVVGAARLELARLRLGISPGRAQEIESDVREALAEESFFSIPKDYLDAILGLGTGFSYDDVEVVRKLLVRAIRLDPVKTTSLFNSYKESIGAGISDNALFRLLMQRTFPAHETYQVLQRFIDDVSNRTTGNLQETD